MSIKLKTLNVLDENLNLFSPYFIEASAGCGKTFSIEHLYVRLLLSDESEINVEDVLVMTFTKEATSELKLRLKKSLLLALEQLKKIEAPTLEYLKVYCQDGLKKEQAQNKIEVALRNFDQSQIFTLHGFGYRLLQKHILTSQISLEEPEQSGLEYLELERLIKDFLTFKMEQKILGYSQMKLLFKAYRNDFSAFLKAVIQILSKEEEVLSYESFQEQYLEIQNVLKQLKEKESLNVHKIYEDLINLAPLYKKGCNKNKELYPDLEVAIDCFSKLFQDDSIDAVDSAIMHMERLFTHFEISNLKKNAKLKEPLANPNLLELISSKLQVAFQKSTSVDCLLATFCSHCHEIWKNYLKSKRSLTPNQILFKCKELLEDDKIEKLISSEYKAAIVDEFQDTDPIQWEIISKLFIDQKDKNFPLYLVGDPKQSIYSFRKADIYTYLKASKFFLEEQQLTLNTNYRSTNSLIDSLNALFGKVNKNWMLLPKENSYLPYVDVNASGKVDEVPFDDKKKALHFLLADTKSFSSYKMAEEKVFLPFIVNEILKAYQSKALPLSSFAILVRDRFQLDRLKNVLKSAKVPFKSKRCDTLKGSKAALHFYNFYSLVIDSKNTKLLNLLLLNPVFKPFSKYLASNRLPALLQHLDYLKEVLESLGFLAFFDAAMQKCALEGTYIYQELLKTDDGLKVYSELEHIKDLIVERESQSRDIEDHSHFLKELTNPSSLYDHLYPLHQNVDEDAVQILTMHMSKGLEFDVVFALGLSQPSAHTEKLISINTQNQEILAPASQFPDQLQSLAQEQSAEKLRQLYVALTRAKKRLYVPTYFAKESTNSKLSALQTFFSRLDLDAESLKNFISQEPNISLDVTDQPISIQFSHEKETIELVKPSPVNLFLKKSYRHSFSSLSKVESVQKENFNPPHDFLESMKTIHTLPAGSKTGTLFHKILEKINFEEDFDILPFIEGSSFEPWKEVIKMQIEKLINLKLNLSGSTVCLKDLSSHKLYKEIEFLYPQSKKLPLNESVKENDFLTGYIDLIFCHQGKYYLVDYKTNWLGSCDESYNQLESEMQSHQYDLQLNIYQEALRKYLKLIDPRPFEDIYGGALYLFIRGLDANSSGLYFSKPIDCKNAS